MQERKLQDDITMVVPGGLAAIGSVCVFIFLPKASRLTMSKRGSFKLEAMCRLVDSIEDAVDSRHFGSILISERFGQSLIKVYIYLEAVSRVPTMCSARLNFTLYCFR